MLSRLAPPEGGANSSTRKADCFGSCVVLTSLSSCRWFTAQARPKPEPVARVTQRHPLITRRVLVLVALSSFQRTDAHRAGNPLPVAFPGQFRPSLGEPSKVTTEDLLCQHQKNCSGIIPFGATVGCLPGLAFRTTYRLPILSQYTRPGWVSESRLALDLSGYWLSRLNRCQNPARAI